MKRHWNYRILAHEHKGEITLQVHEVFYVRGKPSLYTERPIVITGDKISDLYFTIERIKECYDKPILWAGRYWPEAYIPEMKDETT